MSDKTNEGSGSFCIPQRAMNLLLRGYPVEYLDKGNVEERFTFIEVSVICAYLVIANFTGPEGVKSTAGVQALEKYLHCGKVFAERQIKELVRIGVIEDLRANLGDDKSRLAAVRFLVKDFDEPLEDRVWIDRSLVQYFNPESKQSNLDRLCEMGPLCIRFLLWMYVNQPVNSTTVQHPIPSECIPGMMNRYRWDEDQNRTLDSHEIRLACYPEFGLDPFPRTV